MNKKSVELINELIQQSVSIKKYAEQLLEKEINILTERPSATSWNVLECLEHLNRYGNYYLPKIKENLEKSSTAATENFRSSWLGNYFAKSMLSEDSKMKTFKEMNPINSNLDKSVIAVFIAQQEELIQLLELSKTKNIRKIKIPISISRWIRINLGDIFRFVIYHNQRHINQIKRIIT